jgi:hypothetical protein
MKKGGKMKYFAIVNVCKCFDFIFIAYIYIKNPINI